MAVLYYADFSGMDTEKLINAYTDKVDTERLSKLTRTLAPKAKVRSLLAGYLLQVGLREHLGHKDEVLPLQYTYGESGKPYLAEYPGIYFGLSHSEDVVVCVISGQEIGVDVQKHVKVKDGIAQRFFTEEENRFLETLKTEQDAESGTYEEWFFRIWSIKESYIKFTGKGMKQGLNTFDIYFDRGMIQEKDGDAMAYFHEICLEDLTEYAGSVCMKEQEEIRITKVELTEEKEKQDEQSSGM